MSTVWTRSSLIENEDMPSSYLAPSMPGMIPENALFWNSAVRPSFCATAVPRSTSMPMIVLPSVSVNSFGGYDASVPKTILPSARRPPAGTIAASASSLVTVGAADAGASDGAAAGAEAGARRCRRRRPRSPRGRAPARSRRAREDRDRGVGS